MRQHSRVARSRPIYWEPWAMAMAMAPSAATALGHPAGIIGGHGRRVLEIEESWFCVAEQCPATRCGHRCRQPPWVAAAVCRQSTQGTRDRGTEGRGQRNEDKTQEGRTQQVQQMKQLLCRPLRRRAADRMGRAANGAPGPALHIGDGHQPRRPDLAMPVTTAVSHPYLRNGPSSSRSARLSTTTTPQASAPAQRRHPRDSL